MHFINHLIYSFIGIIFIADFTDTYTYLASERSERDTLRSVQLRIVDIYIMVHAIRASFVLITRKEGGA